MIGYVISVVLSQVSSASLARVRFPAHVGSSAKFVEPAATRRHGAARVWISTANGNIQVFLFYESIELGDVSTYNLMWRCCK